MMHRYYCTTLSLILVLCTVCTKTNASTTAALKSYTLYHDIGKGWNPRGSIQLNQDLTVTYEPLISAVDFQDEDDIEWYRIKATEVNDNKSVMTSVPFCSLRRANLREEIQLTLGSYHGDLLSISYTPLISPLAPKSCDNTSLLPLPSSKGFTTKVSYKTAVAAMEIPTVLPEQKVPPGMVPLKGSNSQQSIGSGSNMFQKDGVGQVKPEDQSFIRRYWYIIVPLFLYGLIGGEVPEEKAQGQGHKTAPAQPQRRSKRS